MRTCLYKQLLNIKGNLQVNYCRGNGEYFQKKFPSEYEEIQELYPQDITFAEKLYLYINELEEKPRCQICGKDTIFDCFGVGYNKTCSNECRREYKKINFKETQEKKKKTMLKKYGVEYFSQSKDFKEKCKATKEEKLKKDPNYLKKLSQKRKNTLKEKYGVESFSQTEDFKKKIKETNLRKYGVTSYSKTDEFKKKVQESNLRKFGKKYFTQTEEYKEKNIKTNIKKYGVPHNSMCKEIQLKKQRTYLQKNLDSIKDLVDHSITLEEFIEKKVTGLYSFICKKCGTSFKGYIYNNGRPRCPNCYPYKKSYQEEELRSFILSLNPNFKIMMNSKRIIPPKEIDIYIEDYNLGIEYDGLMFHSFGKDKATLFNNSQEESLLKDYHINKTKDSQEKGVELLHIFENEWLDEVKRSIWKSIIKVKLGIVEEKYYGRKLHIKEVSTKESKKFLTENHLQGYISSSIKLGLYDSKDNLLGIMTLGKSRYSEKYTYELHRLCTKKGVVVIGGASKLFSHFIKNYLEKGETIVSYSDRRYSQGNIYRILGFEYSHTSTPNYFYFKSNSLSLESRLTYQKHKLKDLFEKDGYYNKDKTETEIMYNNDYRKIYDCGNMVFIYKR